MLPKTNTSHIIAIIFLINAISPLGMAAEPEENSILTQSFDRTFEMGSDAILHIKNYRGRIKVRTHAQNNIHIAGQAVPDTSRSDLTLSEVQQMIDSLDIRFNHDIDRLTVDVDYVPVAFKRGIFGIGIFTPQRPSVDLEVVIPMDTGLVIDGYDNDFDIKLGDGFLKIDSYGGSGAIRGIKDDLQIDTYRGDFNIELDDFRKVYIETYKGDVKLTFHNHSNFRLRGETTEGKINAKGITLKPITGSRKTYIDYKEGNGDRDIDLYTNEGTIELEFL